MFMLVGRALKTFLLLGKGSFHIKVLTLVQNITENRLRHARGPVHLHCVRYMYVVVFV